MKKSERRAGEVGKGKESIEIFAVSQLFSSPCAPFADPAVFYRVEKQNGRRRWLSLGLAAA